MKTFLVAFFTAWAFTATGQSLSQLDSLRTVLEKVYNNDQKPREHLDSLQKKMGANSPEVARYWKHINHTDSVNKSIVLAIINRFGWLSAGQTSQNANAALFLTIQHADIATQQKYLPVLKQAVIDRKAQPSAYAYLLDRVAMNTNYYQTYGTQITGDSEGRLCFWPIKDEVHVNRRRKSAGLAPIAVYAGNFGINYKAPAIDSLKGNVVLNIFVATHSQQGIPGVKIFDYKNKLIGLTASNGCLRAVIPRQHINKPLHFIKPGFKTTTYLNKTQADVFYINVVLKPGKSR